MHSTEVSGDRPAMADFRGGRETGETSTGSRAVDLLGHLATALSHWTRHTAPQHPVVIALVCGLAFAGFDGARSLEDARSDVAVLAELAAASMTPRTQAGPPPVPATSLAGHDSIVHADDGTILASTFPSMAPGVVFAPDMMPAGWLWQSATFGGGFGAVVVARPLASVTLPVLARSGGFALVLLLVLAHGRRRSASAPLPHLSTKSEDCSWLDDVPHGVARWCEEGRLVSANAPFFRLLRLDPAQLGPGARYEAVSRRIAGQISARPVLDQAHQRVVDVQRDDGSAIMLDERPCAGGGFITTVVDITERRVADKMLANMREEQRQLARRYHEEKIRAEGASRAKTAFLAHLSHDIRTPLNHIIGFADLMQMETYGPLGDRKYADYLCDIRNSGERLLSAFAQILEFAELEGGRKALKSEPVAVSDLVEGSFSRFRERAARAGVRLDLAANAGAIVAGDRHCLERMLDNLVDNAVRFTPRGGQVRLAAWTGPNGVMIEIADTGVGIDQDQLDRLSQPFALSDAAFTKTSAGAGLGLAIARTIAELSGGRLAVDSMAAIGTTVAVSLPLAPADCQPVSESDQRPATISAHAA